MGSRHRGALGPKTSPFPLRQAHFLFFSTVPSAPLALVSLLESLPGPQQQASSFCLCVVGHQLGVSDTHRRVPSTAVTLLPQSAYVVKNKSRLRLRLDRPLRGGWEHHTTGLDGSQLEAASTSHTPTEQDSHQSPLPWGGGENCPERLKEVLHLHITHLL